MTTISELQAGELYIAVARCSEIPTQRAAEYAKLLAEQEWARNRRYRFERDRHRDLIARALLRSTLGRLLDCEPGKLEFDIDTSGKPHLAPAFSDDGLSFNLSHSGDWVALAVASDTVGIDVENTTRSNDVLAIADRYFFGDEYRELMSFDQAEQAERFFDYWTLKEAYMKARGEGIALGLSNFGFSIRDTINLTLSDAIDDDPEDWQFYCTTPEADYRLALALKSRQRPRFRIEQVEPLRSASALNWSLEPGQPVDRSRS